MKRYKVKERLKTKIVKERRRRKIVLAVTGILGILAVCGLLFRKVSHTLMTSKFFEVKTTDITGACITEPELIRQYLNFNGKNIFCLELGKSRNLVINRFSSIKNANIRRRLPFSISIHIEERVPIAELNIDAARVGIDQDFVSFSLPDNYEHLPVLPANLSDKNRDLCVSFLNGIYELPIYRNIESVNIRVSGGLEFTLKSGGLVLFGGIENVEYKLSYLEQIIADMGYKKKEIEYIDMKDFCSEYKEAVVMPKSKDRI